MTITIDIDEKEIEKAVVDLVIDRCVDNLEQKIFTDDHYSYMRRLYGEGIKDQTRALLKEHLDDIVNRAVVCAGVYIGKKGLKKMDDERCWHDYLTKWMKGLYAHGTEDEADEN